MEHGNLIRVVVRLETGEGRDSAEVLWARLISPRMAKVENIPLYASDVTLGSVVEIDARRNVVRVVENTARTAFGEYWCGPDGDGESRYQVIRDYLAAHDIPCVGYGPGAIGMSVPNDIAFGRLRVLLAECEVPVEVVRDTGRRGGPR